jgi:L-lactate dehydrogenase complex protein LldG
LTARPNPVVDAVRRALGREAGAAVPERPPILPARTAGPVESEVDRLLEEVRALAGVAARVPPDDVESSLDALLEAEAIERATLWPTPGLGELRLAERLAARGVDVVPATAARDDLARCDLGVTEVDFALPETGTIGLLSSPEKPREVSLLPRVHLAVMGPEALRPDLHQVFTEAREHHYLILVSGPSRTADIELTVTLGVHGPRALHLWVV